MYPITSLGWISLAAGGFGLGSTVVRWLLAPYRERRRELAWTWDDEVAYQCDMLRMANERDERESSLEAKYRAVQSAADRDARQPAERVLVPGRGLVDIANEPWRTDAERRVGECRRARGGEGCSGERAAMTVPKPHVQNNSAHPFSEKERTAFFRLWAIRESLPVRDRAFLDGLATAPRLTALAGIRLMALDSDTGNVRAHNVDDYRRRRDRGDGLSPYSDSLTEKIARRRAAKAERAARKAANDAALDALPAGERMALLEERARNAARRRSEFAALSPEQKVERKAILAAERRAHWELTHGGSSGRA